MHWGAEHAGHDLIFGGHSAGEEYSHDTHTMVGKEIAESFGGDYKLLAGCLDIKNNSLIVKNPTREAVPANDASSYF